MSHLIAKAHHSNTGLEKQRPIYDGEMQQLINELDTASDQIGLVKTKILYNNLINVQNIKIIIHFWNK